MDKLNPGIVKTVEWLQSKGFDTRDSGDGETHDYECDLPFPYVHMVTEPETLVSEARRLQAELKSIGIELEPLDEYGEAKAIETSFNPVTNLAIISLFNVKLT